MGLPFVLPPLSEGGRMPCWEGNRFRVGNEFTDILEYGLNHEGWNDGLTEFHEDSAGEQHFIDCASRENAISQLKKYVTHNKPTILEVGCSSGFMLKKIRETFPEANLIGSDAIRGPLCNIAKELPGVPLLCFDMTRCPLPDNTFDAVVILNVLEHIQDDSLAMQHLHRILKPGGIAIIEVPAGPHLYDCYDEVLMHYRRYSMRQLLSLVGEQTFDVVQKSHLGFFLYPGFWYVKKRNRRNPQQNVMMQEKQVKSAIQSTGTSTLMSALVKMEQVLGRWISWPFGIRCIVSCIKKI